MNPIDLTPRQLKRAAALKERIDRLEAELLRLLGASGNSVSRSTKKRTMSAAARRRIAAAQKARWAKARQATSAR